MENKPIKRNENIIPLSKDHHTTLLFCWKLKQGARLQSDPEVMKKYVDYFWKEHMVDHFREEEEILFAPAGGEMVQRAITEHQQIKGQVERIRVAEGEPLKSELLKLAELVDAHVRFEERQLFPHLEETIGADQLAAIGKQLSVKKHPADDFKEEFWMRKM